MKCAIIGLDRYAIVLAIELSALGHEIIVIDTDEKKIDDIKDRVTTAYVLDASDNKSLTSLPLSSVDLVVVCLGQDFTNSLRVIALLKKMNVKKIYARAIDQIHFGILEAFKVDKILTPLKDSARLLAYAMDLGTEVEVLKVDNENIIVKLRIPERLDGFKIEELSIEKDFNIKIIAVTRAKEVTNFLGTVVKEYSTIDHTTTDFVISTNDMFVCYGNYKNFIKMWNTLK